MKRRMPFCLSVLRKMQVVNDHVLARSVAPSGAGVLDTDVIECSTATENLRIITWVMDNTSAMPSNSISREVNLSLFHFNIIIYVTSKYFHVFLLSGLSHCRSGHIPWRVYIGIYDNHHYRWFISQPLRYSIRQTGWHYTTTLNMTLVHATLSINVRNVRKLFPSIQLLLARSSSFYWASVANAPNVLQPYWLIVLPLDVPDLTASLLLWGPSGQRWRRLWTFLFFKCSNFRH